MKANELKLKNIISVNGKEYTVSEIDHYLIGAEGSLQRFKIDEIKPIPLKEEWLLKFGLIDGVFTDLEYFSVRQSFAGGRYYCLYFENEYTATDIGYVHELQNLYFALTGMELTIKE